MTITPTAIRPKSAKQTAAGTAFTVDREAFADEVGKVARYLPERAPVPVLRGVLVEVDALGVTLTVTDYAQVARTFVAADVETPGRFLVHGEHLARIARNMPDGPVRVECGGAYVALTAGRMSFRLLTMPTEDFPDMSKVIEQWRDIDVEGGTPDAPSCRVVDMDGVKPVTSDAQQRGLYGKRGLATMKLWRAPRGTRTLYAPTDLQVGAWITWTRTTNTRQALTDGTTQVIGEKVTEEVTGQVWCADGTRKVWAVVEGEDAPSYVTETKSRDGSWEDGRYRSVFGLTEHVLVELDHEGNPKPSATNIRRRVLAEGSIVVEAEDLQPGDMVVRQQLRDAHVPLHEMGAGPFAGSVVKSVGNKQHRTTYDGRKVYETPVRLRDGKTMTVPDFYAVRVIRPAQTAVAA